MCATKDLAEREADLVMVCIENMTHTIMRHGNESQYYHAMLDHLYELHKLRDAALDHELAMSVIVQHPETYIRLMEMYDA